MSAPRNSWRMLWMKLQGQLIARRRALSLTQSQLADRLLVSLATMKRWESGHVTPSAMALFQWADALGIEITSTVFAGVTSDTNEAA